MRVPAAQSPRNPHAYETGASYPEGCPVGLGQENRCDVRASQLGWGAPSSGLRLQKTPGLSHW